MKDRGMKLYSYIVARDFGFAPNPFYGTCTLATCKPDIRAKAKVGDWVVGTGSKSNGLNGYIAFAMQVSEILTFNEYWHDQRFLRKRPYMHGSLKQAYGDNIYHQDPNSGEWMQADSHHSCADGSLNRGNLVRDTKSENVLVGEEFYYWGGSGPRIPKLYREWEGVDICKNGPSHKCRFPDEMAADFVAWIRSHGVNGYIGDPAEFLTTEA